MKQTHPFRTANAAVCIVTPTVFNLLCFVETDSWFVQVTIETEYQSTQTVSVTFQVRAVMASREHLDEAVNGFWIARVLMVLDEIDDILSSYLYVILWGPS